MRAVCWTLGIRSHRCLHACWRGRSMGPIFDHREAAAGVCGLPRTVCESAGERWRDGAGRLPDLGYPVTPMLAHMLAWAVDGTDFRPSINGGGSVRAAAHGLRECRGAMAQWRGQVAGPQDFGPSVVARILVWVRDATDFRPSITGVGGACASGRTVWESGRERWCDGAGCYRTLRFRPPRCLHAYWHGRATRPIFDHR